MQERALTVNSKYLIMLGENLGYPYLTLTFQEEC